MTYAYDLTGLYSIFIDGSVIGWLFSLVLISVAAVLRLERAAK